MQPTDAFVSPDPTTGPRRPRVLVAEDNDDIRRLVATVLRVDGYSVIEARDGTELLEQLGSALLFGHFGGELDPIDLVITDIRMPGHSGLELLAGLRDADIAVAVILMTAYGDAHTREQARALGADLLVHKPFEIEMLRRTVRALVPLEEPSTML